MVSVIAFFNSKRSHLASAHKTVLEAQKALLGFVKSPECKDIPEGAKEKINTYNDLVELALSAALQHTWDAFVLPVKNLVADVSMEAVSVEVEYVA
jgi:hypothetical protein